MIIGDRITSKELIDGERFFIINSPNYPTKNSQNEGKGFVLVYNYYMPKGTPPTYDISEYSEVEQDSARFCTAWKIRIDAENQKIKLIFNCFTGYGEHEWQHIDDVFCKYENAKEFEN